jgi:hypothetical protein
MNRFRALFMVCFVAAAAAIAVYAADSVGNPRPGYPHDTIIVHVMKADSGPKACDGGHSLFLRHTAGVIPPTEMHITMIDWAQVDNDDDGAADEDQTVDGVDQDGDGLDGEDPIEPGADTKALDCDAYADGKVSLQIRDTDPRQGWVSTQEWFMRLIGKPNQNFAFTSYANQTVSCTVLSDPDGTPNSGDEVTECTYGATVADWVKLAEFNLRDLGCVKSVKAGGKAGGKTPFCDITDGFEVDVDTSGDGVVDAVDQFVFSVSCWDNPATEPDETLYCPLSGIIWDIDEEETTSQAKAQIFVAHTGTARVQAGKIR